MNKPLNNTLLSAKARIWLPILALLGLSLVRFAGINGGLVLGEPDEFIHQAVAENFKKSPWPVYNGAPWFFQMPLYPFLGYLLSFVFPQRYVSLRVVSVSASILLILATYYFISRLFSKRAGFITALIMILSPFSIYISRLALLDSSVVAFGILALYLADRAVAENKLRWAVWSGLSLSLSLMFKYTGLIYFMSVIVFLLFAVVKDNTPHDLKEGLLKLRLTVSLPVFLVIIMITPILLLLRSHDSYFFKLQLFTSLGFIHDFWRIKGGELSLLYYWREVPWWLTWPVLVLFMGGLLKAIGNFRKFPIFLLGFLLTVLVAGPFRPFYPRYFYPFVPYGAVMAGLFLDSLWQRFGQPAGLVILSLVITVMLPTSVESFRSTQHNLIEETGQAMAKFQLKDPWIFANYWPNFFGSVVDSSKATWLSESRWDATAYVVDIMDSPVNVLRKEGGFALLEKDYSTSKIFINPEVRLRAVNLISKQYPLKQVIVDSSPNFPYFRSQNNEVDLYLISASN